jgi:nicotinamidase-related amidase
MTAAEGDLHGNAPDNSPLALIMIDVINDLEFPEGPQTLAPALAMAEQLIQLAGRARACGVPVIYVNDNWGRWRSDFRAQVEHCLHDHVRGQPVVELLKPQPQDYYVLKPKPSGFYGTPLGLLLDHIQARTLILTGLTADICVLLTASDASQRGFRVIVPGDCVASHSTEQTTLALQLMQSALEVEIGPAADLDVHQLQANVARRM